MAQRKGRGAKLAELLRRLVQASSDFEGAVLVSLEGLVLAAEWPISDQDDSDVGAAATRAFQLSERTTMALERGELERLILVGAGGNMIITRAGQQALCVVMLKPEAKLGIASFEAMRISREIARVLD